MCRLLQRQRFVHLEATWFLLTSVTPSEVDDEKMRKTNKPVNENSNVIQLVLKSLHHKVRGGPSGGTRSTARGPPTAWGHYLWARVPTLVRNPGLSNQLASTPGQPMGGAAGSAGREEADDASSSVFSSGCASTQGPPGHGPTVPTSLSPPLRPGLAGPLW